MLTFSHFIVTEDVCDQSTQLLVPDSAVKSLSTSSNSELLTEVKQNVMGGGKLGDDTVNFTQPMLKK